MTFVVPLFVPWLVITDDISYFTLVLDNALKCSSRSKLPIANKLSETMATFREKNVFNCLKSLFHPELSAVSWCGDDLCQSPLMITHDDAVCFQRYRRYRSITITAFYYYYKLIKNAVLIFFSPPNNLTS